MTDDLTQLLEAFDTFRARVRARLAAGHSWYSDAWRPRQAGGQPKVRTMTESQKRRLLVIGQSSQFQDSRQ